MKPVEKSLWDLRGNCKGDLQVTIPQDLNVGHRHLQLVLFFEVGLGVRGHSSDVPCPCSLAVRAGCESRGAVKSVPSSGTKPGHPQSMEHPHPVQATKFPQGCLCRSRVTALTWV